MAAPTFTAPSSRQRNTKKPLRGCELDTGNTSSALVPLGVSGCNTMSYELIHSHLLITPYAAGVRVIGPSQARGTSMAAK